MQIIPKTQSTALCPKAYLQKISQTFIHNYLSNLVTAEQTNQQTGMKTFTPWLSWLGMNKQTNADPE